MSAEKTVLQNVSSRMKLMGWLSIIFGILAMAMPWVAGQSILMVVGVLVMAAGIMRMIWAFQAGSLGKGILVFVIGVLTLLAGIAVLANPLMSSAVLTIMLAIYFFVDGISELVAAFSVSEGKGWLLFDAVVTIILGIKLLFVGITMLTIRSVARNAVGVD